jgi:hypothetical protein
MILLISASWVASVSYQCLVNGNFKSDERIRDLEIFKIHILSDRKQPPLQDYSIVCSEAVLISVSGNNLYNMVIRPQ